MERYDILERLAVGGMGEVFLARQRGQGGFARTVVIKQLLPDAAEEGARARRLFDEARLAASVAHENVVTSTRRGHGPIPGGFDDDDELDHSASKEQLALAEAP